MPRAYRQGELDGLCGIYSVVNGINHLLSVRPPPGFSEDLFAVVAHAVPKRCYPDVLWDGMEVEELVRIARKAAKHLDEEIGFRIEVSRPFARRRFSDRESFFDAVDAALAERFSVMILQIDWAKKDGGGGHWSVLREVTRDHVRLVDSDRVTQVPTRYLAVSGRRGTRIHPPSTVMLTLAEIEGERVS